MTNKLKSLIIGKGQGISKYLSNELDITCISSSEIYKLDFSEYDHIIYTSTNPSHFINLENMSSYIQKNFRNIFYLLESNFKGRITYLSSVDAGSFKIKRIDSHDQVEEMYTPYSFSKYTLESLLINHKYFAQCHILRLGLLWPAKFDSNIMKALKDHPDDLSLNLNSTYYITPYSLILNFLKGSFFNKTKKNIFGYLMSSNKLKLSSLFDLRGFEFDKYNDESYSYITKEKDNKFPNLAEGGWFNWEEENDYNNLIAKALLISGNEKILPKGSL